jgi:hypothetical protein
MSVYHTNLFSTDPPGDAFFSRGAAWSFEKESGIFSGTRAEVRAHFLRLKRERGGSGPATISDVGTSFFDMEIIIKARGLAQARQAMNLLVSAVAVLEGSINHCPEPFSMDPRPVGTALRPPFWSHSKDVLNACKLANRTSRNRSASYALHKLALSYRSSSPNWVDLQPGEWPREFRVQNDPIYHVYLANAITLAYSAIEELGLEPRATRDNPSKMPDGTWNPAVKTNLEARLRGSGIDLSEMAIWTLRGPKTRIERHRPVPHMGKARWSGGHVRDANVRLIDALALASWLRSKTTAHRFSEPARSLTVYDAHNIQSLARRLILERFGFWRDGA